ncbi:MAG TPA: four helix bundle protein [Bacteroidales bacterium]|nr:four helix bundle protein [Bacteroidales bacterium]
MKLETDWIKFKKELRDRLKIFALDIIKLVQNLPKTPEAKTIGNQLLRSGTSTYANYRAALRGRSRAEFYSKLSISVEEGDESEMWLDILIESEMSTNQETKRLHAESIELIKILSHLRKKISNK